MVVFLVETKSNNVRLESVRKKLGFYSALCINSIGKMGGLALLWKYELKVEIINYSQWHISTWVELKGSPFKWIFTDFYGELETSKWHLSLNLLKELKPSNNTPLVVMGDFNEILFHHEKWDDKEPSKTLWQILGIL